MGNWFCTGHGWDESLTSSVCPSSVLLSSPDSRSHTLLKWELEREFSFHPAPPKLYLPAFLLRLVLLPLISRGQPELADALARLEVPHAAQVGTRASQCQLSKIWPASSHRTVLSSLPLMMCLAVTQTEVTLSVCPSSVLESSQDSRSHMLLSKGELDKSTQLHEDHDLS